MTCVPIMIYAPSVMHPAAAAIWSVVRNPSTVTSFSLVTRRGTKEQGCSSSCAISAPSQDENQTRYYKMCPSPGQVNQN
ncbi:hypothetical protein E2C01_015263 [Portunus trituberculatus]|uniref:Uncharacterized protein n=1 Tax=Portunus trituberculatus TaxID=210409 RepID=A0A5B7DMH2_PORTR|nr:hypothetical protein [Portunus trituberculatus]